VRNRLSKPPPELPELDDRRRAELHEALAGELARLRDEYGFFRGDRLLSRPSVELMMTDQLTAEQKAASSMGDGFFDAFGWGFGMAVCTKRVDVETNPGRVGWDGGLGTAWTVDRGETLVTILMTQKLWDSPRPPKVVRDFRTAAYAALDD
jgi:CubicO group peptidase (beta-lactamase class C family)